MDPTLNDDETQALVRSLVDERILLLARLKAHQDRWDQVLKLTTHPTGPAKLATLLRVHVIAEEALAL